ncbi:hypothetical protein SAMN05421505_11280 [Sinosporangium album]|uniref:Uncharacterized protein n=1 Tax=Sinosporangium album TaxID=504805 RepID=A0A1G8AAN6_9ACTN|nr:hypothetical protein [Sinosporangium album]SDH17951.1 hypothetical protein SAMN05421505_11280 [Sinosporangium album]
MTVTLDNEDYPCYMWEIQPESLAAIYAMQGWPIADAENGYPTADEIEAVVRRMVDGLERDERDSATLYLSSARMLVYRDPDFPSSYEIYLHVGYVDMEGG